MPPITYSYTAHCLISLSDWIPPPQPNFFAKGTGGTHRPHIVHFTTYNHMCSIDFTRWLFFIQFASYLNYCVLHSNINRRGVISMTFSQSKISVRPFMLAWVQTLLLTSTFPPKKLTEEIDDQSWVCFDSINMTSSYLVAIYHGVGICYICQSSY